MKDRGSDCNDLSTMIAEASKYTHGLVDTEDEMIQVNARFSRGNPKYLPVSKSRQGLLPTLDRLDEGRYILRAE